MSIQGVDIAWARPTTAEIKATGSQFVCRYLSPDSSKNITAAEVQDYAANGLSVVVVWESTADRMLGGYAAGQADAQAAEVQRAAVGLPNSMPIYFGCDFDAQPHQYHTVNEYLRGVNSVIGLGRTGIYAGYYVIENVFSSPATATYGWQADAWSNGNWSSHAALRQEGGTLLAGNADVDYAEAADFGQYPRPTNGDDMPLTDADVQKVAAAVTSKVLGYVNGPAGTPDLYGMIGDVHKATVAPSIKSLVDGAEHTLGDHTAATNAAAFATRAELAPIEAKVDTIATTVAALAKKLGA